MAESPNLHLLLLAAGESKRMGRIKQILPWENTTLLEHALNQALQSRVDKVSLVLGAHSETILKCIDGSKAEIYINNDWKRGLASSIAYGIKEILKTAQPDAILIALADQPFVSSDYYNQMISKYSADKKILIASHYENSYGVPALFGSHYFDSLLHLKGDAGAKKLILENADHLIALEASEYHRDIDDMQMYKEALQSRK